MPSGKTASVRDRRREQELELRRADVVAAASVVFAEKGFQGTQVAEIATAAELGLNTVYGLFKGKDELYEAVIQDAATTVRDRVQAEVEAISDPAEQLLGVIDALLACFEENRHLLRIYSHSTHGLPWRARQGLGDGSFEVFRDFTTWLFQIASRAKDTGALRDLDPETFSLALIGAVTTTAARWVEAPTQESLSAVAPRIRTLFERLLEREE